MVAVQKCVYRLPGNAVDTRQAVLAAAHRAGGYATGWSALGLRGVLDRHGLAPWIAVPEEVRVHGVDFIVQREPLAQRDRRSVDGVPCVGPFLSLCDYARRVRGRRLLDGIDESRRAGLISLERLRERAVELGKHRGAVEIRQMFDQGMLDQDGEGERRLAAALAGVGLFPLWGVEVVRGTIVDACLPDSSLIPEFDGARWHLPGRHGLDGARRGTLEADGWAFEIVTWADVAHRPAQTARSIRALHDARASAGLGRPPHWHPYRNGRQFSGRLPDTVSGSR